jgi:dethiobiotin synthetase
MPARVSCDLPGLFLTGTDTGVGKTWVAAGVAESLVRSGARVAVVKPVATGVDPAGPVPADSDAARLRLAAGRDVAIDRVNPFRFAAPVAPPVAARLAGSPLSYATVLAGLQASLDGWGACSDIVLVEGVGGFLCPLAEGHTVADLAVDLDFPLVIVARRGLGTLNHTLLTVEAARRRGARVAGIVFNEVWPAPEGLAEQTNAAELARWLDAEPILAEFSYNLPSDAAALAFDRIAWRSLARPSRFRPGDS